MESSFHYLYRVLGRIKPHSEVGFSSSTSFIQIKTYQKEEKNLIHQESDTKNILI